ncbi:hypothetical protein CGCFRS4_v014000 [Colletotrichum fructicola]|nr:hypothetical protein CGCFRS4_v014000 [Colletotrichum fructicola]KAF4924940.1 hypothetical protein CGCF245_v014286 [Colletotrichum fructicola]
MEQRVFEKHLAKCTHVHEDTTYLEILRYVDKSKSIFKGSLSDAEAVRYFRGEGEFDRTSRIGSVQSSSSLRFVLQSNAKDPKTFTPLTLSLHPNLFQSMLKDMRLPLQAVELTSVVGPLFWHRYTEINGNDPHLQIVCGKQDSRQTGKTRGWQLILSYSFRRRQTTAFVKGTLTSVIPESLEDLESCADETFHPLLFPVFVLCYVISMRSELSQRKCRTWIRRLEDAISVNETAAGLSYFKDGKINLRAVASDLTECHRQVLHQRPGLYSRMLGAAEEAMQSFWIHVSSGEKSEEMKSLHFSLQDRLGLQRARLVGLDSYVSVSIERLNIQRSMISFITAEIAQNDAKLNLKIAGDQRQLANDSKRSRRIFAFAKNLDLLRLHNSIDSTGSARLVLLGTEKKAPDGKPPIIF